MLCRITRASGGLRTVDIHSCSLHYPVALCRAGLYCTLCSYAHREYTVWPWHPYTCVTSGHCGWQRWWPDICRCCIGIEMAGDRALCCHGGGSAGVSGRQVGCAYGQRGWKAQPLGMSSPCGTSPTMGRVQGGVRPGGVAAATRVAVYGCLGCL